MTPAKVRTYGEILQDVESLRHEVFRHPAGPAASPLMDELLAAEKALANAERPSGDAAVLSTMANQPKRLLSAETTGISAEVKLKMLQVPGSIVHLLDPERYPLLRISLQNGKTDKVRRVRVSTYVEGYSATAVNSVELPVAAPPVILQQLPTFFPAGLAQLHDITRATVNVCVEDLDGKIELQNTKPVWIAPRTTAVLSTRDPDTGAVYDFTPYLAAFVTPNAPAVIGFLRKCAGLHPSGRLVGYQGSAAQGVGDQVEAVYKALKQSGIVYINSVIASSVDGDSAVQRVRLPAESLAAQSANCIDGAVLFASLLSAASIEPALVIVPGHALMAWERWRGTGEWKYLETTMLGTHDFADACAAGEALAARYLEMEPTPLRLRVLRECRAQGVFALE